MPADSPPADRLVSRLYGRHDGEDIYILGTGTSARTFPLELLEGRTVIGLNMAWKIAPITYGLTVHPDLNMPELMEGEQPLPDITWITKFDKTRKLLSEEQFTAVQERFYYFRSDGQPNSAPVNEPNDAGRILDWVREPTEDYLYQWSSIAQTACNLAANLGARNIFLVGCDNCGLLDNHHAHAQHTRWKGVSPEHRYQQYYDGLAEVRQALRGRGVSVVSVTPFVSLCHPDMDFLRLCEELGIPQHVDNPDITGGSHGWKRIKRKLKSALKKRKP